MLGYFSIDFTSCRSIEKGFTALQKKTSSGRLSKGTWANQAGPAHLPPADQSTGTKVNAPLDRDPTAETDLTKKWAAGTDGNGGGLPGACRSIAGVGCGVRLDAPLARGRPEQSRLSRRTTSARR
jgi:hypothetical protein